MVSAGCLTAFFFSVAAAEIVAVSFSFKGKICTGVVFAGWVLTFLRETVLVLKV